MKKLLITLTLIAALPAQAETTQDLRKFIRLTSALSDYCLEITARSTIDNDACKQMLINMRTLKRVDNEELSIAIVNKTTEDHLNNIISNARAVKVVHTQRSY